MSTADEHARRLRRYADLLVRVGANVAEGQYVAVDGLVEHAELARAVADAAYGAGARYVDVRYADLHVRRSMLEKAPDESLTFSPPWMVERLERLGSDHAAQVLLVGNPDPYLFSELDAGRVGRARQVAFDEAHDRNIMTKAVNWTIAACPSPGWADSIYGEPDTPRLWRELAYVVRLDEIDPVAVWDAHLETLQQRVDLLNENRFDALRFVGPETELTVGLLPSSRWLSASMHTASGRSHVANIPTEEVYTTPDRSRADGVVRATRPLVLPAGVVRGLQLRFEEGRIVSIEAEEGLEYVRAQLEVDEGASRLGEIALVDRSSRVGQIDHPFFNALLDENASSHIAYGSGFPYAVEGSEDWDEAEQLAAGLNRSAVHTDVMVGGEGVDVLGITATGDERCILADNEWRLG